MAQIEIITSAANPLLKDIRKAASRGALTSKGLWIAESFHLLDEALSSDLNVPVVLTAESSRALVEPKVTQRLIVLPDKLFQELSTTGTTQGVMALVEPPEWEMDRLFDRESPVLILDGIQDPGNAGSIVRSAEAFGASGVIFLKGTASPHHPKMLRAAAGSLFRIPFVAGIEAGEIGSLLKRHHRTAYAAMPAGRGVPVFDRKCAIAIGSEGRGLSREVLAISQPVAIETSGVESLNASIAAAVLLYEAQRQRA